MFVVFAVWAGNRFRCFFVCCLGGPGEGRVFFSAVWAWRRVFAVWAWAYAFFAVWAGCVFFLFAVWAGCDFFAVWAGSVFVFLLFGRGGREFTHLPVCLARL